MKESNAMNALYRRGRFIFGSPEKILFFALKVFFYLWISIAQKMQQKIKFFFSFLTVNILQHKAILNEIRA